MVKNPAEKNLNLITKAHTTINVRPIKVTMNVEDPSMGIITIRAENFILFIFSLMFRMILGIIFFLIINRN